MDHHKAALRGELRHDRLLMLPEDRQVKSTAIAGKLWQAVDWFKVATVHCFEPIERLGEVDITDFVGALQVEYPNIRLFTARQIKNVWRVVSLTDGKPVSPPQFEVIIVPMLGFDKNLQRIGYGSGYYDRFLVTQFNAKKIGVSFEIGKIPLVPTEPHDIPLDIIITERALYHG